MNASKILVFCLFANLLCAQKVAVLKYKGGGDWYSNPTSVTDLVNFCNKQIQTNIALPYAVVEPDSSEIFNYPIVFMTGHGNVFFSEADIENLKTYLLSGGFLHIDDNYGMKPYLVRELDKLFPDKKMVELPVNHPIFSAYYKFPAGLPKIHEHDGKRPQAFGYFDDQNRLILLFTYECDLSDGWENPEVHHDPADIRLKALQMGANIVSYVFEN